LLVFGAIWQRNCYGDDGTDTCCEMIVKSERAITNSTPAELGGVKTRINCEYVNIRYRVGLDSRRTPALTSAPHEDARQGVVTGC